MIYIGSSKKKETRARVRQIETSTERDARLQSGEIDNVFSLQN